MRNRSRGASHTQGEEEEPLLESSILPDMEFPRVEGITLVLRDEHEDEERQLRSHTPPFQVGQPISICLRRPFVLAFLSGILSLLLLEDVQN